MNIIPNGAIKDPRTSEQIAKDYLHPAGATGVNWVEKTSFKKYTQRNQDGSLSCGLQAGAKALECLTGKIISATPYFWRKNYPGEGTFMQDIGDILYNRFSCLESSSPSQNQNETQMNTIKPLTTNIGITGYRSITSPDIELIAEAIENHKQCIIWIDSNSYEYTTMPEYNGQTPTFSHYVCGVDYGLHNGQKVIAIEDSAGQWSAPDGCRLFTADFLQKRMNRGLYFLGAKDVTVPQDNKFKFLKDLQYGDRGNEVTKLQQRLIDMGYTIPAGSTGYYGEQTQAAVFRYQLINVPNLSFWDKWYKGKYFGSKTRTVLNMT
jgi:hypothetical protein